MSGRELVSTLFQARVLLLNDSTTAIGSFKKITTEKITSGYNFFKKIACDFRCITTLFLTMPSCSDSKFCLKKEGGKSSSKNNMS